MIKENILIIRKDDSYFIVEQESLKNISHTEAQILAQSTLDELNKTLVDEAISNKQLYVGKQKLIDGLKNTLNFLNKNFSELFTDKDSLN